MQHTRKREWPNRDPPYTQNLGNLRYPCWICKFKTNEDNGSKLGPIVTLYKPRNSEKAFHRLELWILFILGSGCCSSNILFKNLTLATEMNDREKIKAMQKQYGQNLKQFVDLQSTMNFIKENSMPCPKCNMAIQKSEGCNKMTCGFCGVSHNACYWWKLLMSYLFKNFIITLKFRS